jgi:sugar-phosphatase
MNTVTTEAHSTIPVEIAVAGMLFDMDGVLVRSTHGDERCWTRWAAQHGLSGTFDLRRTHGRRAVDTIREHLPELTAEDVEDHLAQLDMLAEEEQGGVLAYPGASELLKSIPPYRWTIVTSASEKMMHNRLRAAGMTVPRYAVGGDTISMGKPHPEGYLRGAGILSRRPEECLVIEDAPAGVRAGKAAGCQVLAVASSHRPDELHEADWIVSAIDRIAVSVDPETASLTLKFPAIQIWR